MDAKKRALYSQYAENVYFGKPSGLMDQMASSVGGLTYIDFKNDDPRIEEMTYDFAAKGFALVVVNTGGSHDDLTEHYAAIPAEMRAVARSFSCSRMAQSNMPKPFSPNSSHCTCTVSVVSGAK
ncbi:hypothetical protein SDC9_188945 [bioreactor metagenome]|uniref:Uncharacterized protein n=1 Tax=bioreactor metagenome TaxID=1076179 RepID=A0A645HT65_9ZZZZ